MEYRRLGQAGIKVSALSFGSWLTFGQQIGDDVAAELMKTAYDNGVIFFDNAEAYAGGRSEMVMGAILKKMGWTHDTFVVSSKVFWGGKLPNQEGLSRKHVIEACHNALRRLQVDYLDLYFCHRHDPDTPMVETVRAMSDLVHQGKVLYWGTSQWDAPQIEEAHQVARDYQLVPPTMEQPQYNLFHRERVEQELAPLYAKYGLGTTTWSPLASGLLTGKYHNGTSGDTRAKLQNYGWLREQITQEVQAKAGKVKHLEALARELGLSLAVFSLAWCLKNPHVSTVILGASKVPQLNENLQAVAAQAKLTPEVMKQIDEIVG